MTSTPIWFLDIDGVVNAIADGIPPGYQRTTAITLGRGWRIVYSPEVVDFINLANREGFAEVRWLTTWEQDTHRSLAPKVGLDAFPAYDIPDADSTSGWWKADVVAASIKEEGRAFVWTDDDLETEDVGFLETSRLPTSLPIATIPAVGLSKPDLARITTFLIEHRNNAIADDNVPNLTRRQVEDCMLVMGWNDTQPPLEQLERWSHLIPAMVDEAIEGGWI
jgi:hypothetical protein